jgi:hypothetical protein
MKKIKYENNKKILKDTPLHEERFDTELHKPLILVCETVEEFFYQWYEEGIFDQAKVPIAALYYQYCEELQLSNCAAKIVSLRRFTQTIQSLVHKYSLRVSDTRTVVSTVKPRMCNLRELFYGHDFTELAQCSSGRDTLKRKCKCVVNDNPTAFFYHYLSNHSKDQLDQLMDEIAACKGLPTYVIYLMSQREIEELYNLYKDQLSENLT